MCSFSEAEAGRRWAGEAGGKPERPQEPKPASGAKATNFASYSRAVAVAGSSRASPASRAHFCLEGCVEIVGYNQGNRKGGLGFPLLSSFSESVTK